MRRLVLMPFLIFSGCWDFEALNFKTVETPGDGFSIDLTGCKQSVLAEICDNGIDDNDDCLTDCLDPQCAGDKNCFSGPLFSSYVSTGTLEAAAVSCTGKKDLVTDIDNKSTCQGCKCTQLGTSKLTAFVDGASCTAGTKLGNDIILSSDLSAPKCYDVAAGVGVAQLATYRYKLDDTLVSCTPDAAAAKPDLAWKTSGAFCPTTPQQKCDSFKCLADSGNKCVSFKGTVSCPTAFPKATTWLEAATVVDGRKCSCDCNNKTPTVYTPADSDMKFSDDKACGGTTANFGNQVKTCSDNKLAGAKVAAGFSFSAKVTCNSTNSIPTNDPKLVTGQATTICCTN